MNTTHKVVAGLALGAGLMMSAPNTARAADAVGMGMTQSAGPFQVTLIGDPKTGRSRFEARVTRDGQPVTDAKVTLYLSMPSHRHGAGVSKLRSQTGLDQGYAQYSGTALLMAGTNEARVTVQDGSDKGTALYSFEAGRKPYVAHLGMWHPAGGFEVRLTTDPAQPTTGENRFIVQVTREGFPVTDAEVSISLDMPQMSKMGSAKSYAKLTPTNGAYEGTAKLHAAGGQQARITVKSGGAKGIATYDFPAGK